MQNSYVSGLLDKFLHFQSGQTASVQGASCGHSRAMAGARNAVVAPSVRSLRAGAAGPLDGVTPLAKGSPLPARRALHPAGHKPANRQRPLKAHEFVKQRTRQRGLPLVIQTTVLFLAVVLSLSYASVASAAEEGAAAETRVSLTRKGDGEARSTQDYASTTTDEFPALETSSQKNGSTENARKPTAAGDQQESAFGDYWIYSVDVELFSDNDRDGFFHGIDLLFDADTIYAIADVYAVAYLSYEGGPWNEYAVSPDITLFGSTSTDDYVLVTELLTGYPSGRYDILVELYESATGVYVASVGPSESFELVDLPLEDANRDQPQQPVSVTRGGGGASNTAFLIALLAVLLLLKQRDRGRAHRGNES